MTEASIDGSSDLGLYCHLHCLVTDGAFEERGCELPFLAAPPPTPERMTAILARVHDAIIAQDSDAELDLDPALATCIQQSLRGHDPFDDDDFHLLDRAGLTDAE